MADNHVTTVRFSTEMAEALAAVAHTEGVAVSELIRQAVADLVARKRQDPDFIARLERRAAEDRAILERLAAGPSDV